MSALPGNEPAVFAFGPFVLDRDRRLLTRGGAAVSKDELMSALWPDTAVEESNLAFQVSTLRKALGADGARFIATLPGRLLRTHDGKPLWATQLDENAGDLFAVQDQVAENVAREVVPALSPQPARQPTADLEAYGLYLKGRYLMMRPRQAIELYRQAVERDPKFAAAWAAMKAVTLDPELADGHAALTQVYADHDWDYARAELEFRRALELNPNSDIAHGQFSTLLMLRRDFDGALAHVRRAREIDPLSPIWALFHAGVLHTAGRDDEAIAVNASSGRSGAAIEALQRGLKIEPRSVQLLPLLAWAEAKAGNRDAAIAGPNIVMAYIALGDHDRAFYWLERGVEERLHLARLVAVMPEFEPLRSDPRYAELVKRMGL